MVKRADREKKKNTPEIDVSLTYKNDTPVDCKPPKKSAGSASTDDYVKIEGNLNTKIGIDGSYYCAFDKDKAEELGYSYNLEKNRVEKIFYFNIFNDSGYLNFDAIKNSDSTLSPYEQIREFILKNKDNHYSIRKTVSELLANLEDHYDHSKKHIDLPHAAQTFTDALNLEDEEEMSGLICGTIHQQVMTALQECGISACIVRGVTYDGKHATLIIIMRLISHLEKTSNKGFLKSIKLSIIFRSDKLVSLNLH